MSKPGLCCDKCFFLIAERNATAAKLWLDLCQVQENCLCFGLKLLDNPYLELLEELRFITTTDTKDMILVKVQGIAFDEAGAFFCGGLCNA